MNFDSIMLTPLKNLFTEDGFETDIIPQVVDI